MIAALFALHIEKCDIKSEGGSSALTKIEGFLHNCF